MGNMHEPQYMYCHVYLGKILFFNWSLCFQYILCVFLAIHFNCVHCTLIIMLMVILLFSNNVYFFHQSLLSDATLACEGQLYPVHKLVLSTCSEFFGRIFSSTPCKHPVIVLHDLRPQHLHYLLSYMYSGEVNVPQSQLPTLIRAAETLQIKGIAAPDEDSCQGFADDFVGEQEHPKAFDSNNKIQDESNGIYSSDIKHSRKKRQSTSNAEASDGDAPNSSSKRPKRSSHTTCLVSDNEEERSYSAHDQPSFNSPVKNEDYNSQVNDKVRLLCYYVYIIIFILLCIS